MKHLTHCGLLMASLALLATGLGLAAPAKKEKEEPPGPVRKEQFDTSERNLKDVGLAWHNYEATWGFFPCDSVDKKGKPLLSWRVLILPYIEEQKLYEQFKLDEPWDSEHNKKLIGKMPKIYAPVRGKRDPGLTFYQAFTGKHGLISAGEKRTIAQIVDGTSNTLMVVESAKPVIWSKPGDLVFDGKDVPALGGLFDGQFHAAMCDGSIQRFKKGIDAEVLRRLNDPADGNVVDLRQAVDSDK